MNVNILWDQEKEEKKFLCYIAFCLKTLLICSNKEIRNISAKKHL